MKTEQSKRRYLRYATILLIAIFLLSAVLLGISLWEKAQGRFDTPGSDTLSDSIIYNEKEYVRKDNLETLLVLGLDKFENTGSGSYNNDKQADFLMLFVIDNENQSFAAIHINRDSMVDMDVLGVAGDKVGSVRQQLALAHTYGNGKEVSCRNTANAVSDLLLHAEIDHYLSVTMDAVPVLNDSVGGVTIEVLDDFTGIDDTLVKGEMVTLMGEHALTYVRSRYGLDNSSNDNRMVRQRQYLEALYDKALQCANENESFVAETAVKMADYMVSDCSGNKLEALLEKLSDYTFTEVYDIQGESVLGEEFMEFYPAEDSIKQIVIDTFYTLKN